MNSSITHHGMQVVTPPLTLAALLLMTSASAGSATVDPPEVQAFKEFLRCTPCVREIRFVKTQRPPAPSIGYVGAAWGDDFFLRPWTPGTDPRTLISFTNQASLGVFVGQHGDKRWTINGLNVVEANFPVAFPNIDPHSASVRVGVDELKSILALGPNILEPGSFEWNGPRFRARATWLLQMASPRADFVDGEIMAREGVVVEMRIDSPLTQRYLYSYAPVGPLPHGIPSTIIAGQSETRFDWKYTIHSLVVADEIVETNFFEPYRHMDARFMSVSILSNGVRSTVKDNTRAIVAEVYRGQRWNPRLWAARVLLLTVCALGGVWAIRMLRNRTRSDSKVDLPRRV